MPPLIDLGVPTITEEERARTPEKEDHKEERSSSCDSTNSSNNEPSECRRTVILSDQDKIDKIQKAQSKRLFLNISGRKFETCVSTLAAVPNNLLHRLVQKDIGVKPYSTEGVYTYFIDRDSSHFRIILNYLRNQTRIHPDTLPRELNYLREIQSEAKFYELNHLSEVVEERIFFLQGYRK